MTAVAASGAPDRFTAPAQEFAPWIHALIFVLTRVLSAGQYGRIMRRVLLTAASFQGAPDEHHNLLQDAGFEIVHDIVPEGNCVKSGPWKRLTGPGAASRVYTV